MRHFKYVLGLLVIAMASGCGGAPAPVAKKKPQVKKTATSQKKGTNSTSKPSASTGSEDKGTPFPIPIALDEVPGDTPSTTTDEKANQADLPLVQTDLGSGGLELFIDAPSGATVSKGSFYAEVVLREVFQVMICSQPENLESQLAEAKKPTAYDKFAGIELQDKDRLVLHLKDHFDGFSKYAVFVNKKIGKDTYCIKNDIALWKPKSKAELAVVLKSIDSLRPKQPVVEIAAEADRKLEPQNELFQKLPGRIAFNSFAFTHMAWSPDKNVFYSLGGDLLESWQFPEKKRLQAVERYPLDMIAMAPNGKWLVGASDEGEIEIRDPKSLEVVRKIDIKSKVNVLAVSPDSAVICFGQEDGIISLYNPTNLQLVGKLTGHSKKVKFLVFAPKSGQLASCAEEEHGNLRIWDLTSKKPIHNLTTTPSAERLSFFPDETRLAIAAYSRNLQIWDIVNEKLEHEWNCLGIGGSIAVSLDGNHIFGSDDGLVVVNAKSGAVLRRLQSKSNWKMALSPDGKWLAAGGHNLIQIWDVKRLLDDKDAYRIFGNESLSLNEHSEAPDRSALRGLFSVRYSPNGKYIASADSGSRVVVRDTSNWQVMFEVEEVGVSGCVAAFSSESNLLAAATSSGVLETREVPSGKKLRRHAHHWGDHMVLVQNGKQAITNRDNETIVIDSDTGEVVGEFKGHADKVVDVALSKNEKTLYTLSKEKAIKIWNVDNRTLTHTIPIETDQPLSSAALSVSADSKWIAVRADDLLKIWDANSLKLVHDLKEDLDTTICCAEFSPDSRTLCSPNHEFVVLWDVGTGKVIKKLCGHTDSVSCADFSPDGTALATGGYDGTVKIWDLSKMSP